MRIFILLFVLIFSNGMVAQSQQPAQKAIPNIQPSNQDRKDPAKKTPNKQHETKDILLFVKSVEAEKTREHINQERSENDKKAEPDDALVFWTFILALVTGLLAAIAIGQLCMFFKQLMLMKTGAADTKAIARSAQSSAQAAKIQSEALMSAERAYVKMSHNLPGLHIEKENNLFEITIEIKNHGRTPTTVTDVVIDAKLLENGVLLQKPFPFRQENREAVPSAFLVTQEAFTITKCFPLRGDNMKDTMFFAKKLWIFGHVDYIDTFGNRYRGGYVRTYNPHLDDGKKNNLVYMNEDQYNYDRQRKNGEGNDWDEKNES